MKKVLIGLTAFVVVSMVVLAGCKKKEEAEIGPPPPVPYKVGAVLDVTGKAAWLGEPEKKTVEMVVRQVNAAGGINGHPLMVIVEDNASEEATAVIAMKKLVDSDKVCAVIGPSQSGTTLAVVPIAMEKKVPLISCAAAARIVQPAAEKFWVFKVPQMDSDCVRRIYDYMKEKGWTKAALITVTDGFGSAGREQLKTIAKEYKIEIAADETYLPTDTDMTVQLTKIKNTEAQALISWSIAPGQSTVIRNARQLGLTIPLFQSHGFGNIKYVQAAGEAADGVLFPAGKLLSVEDVPDADPQKKVLVQYKKDYESEYKEPVSTFGGHGYDALNLVIDALKAVGPNRAKIRDYIENRKGFIGTAGVFNFSPTDHCGLDKTAFVMYTVKGQKFTLLK